MENKNESKIWEKDEVLSKESKKTESPKTFETNDDNLEKAKEIGNEEKQETMGKEVNEGKIETKEFDQLIEDVDRFNKSFEKSRRNRPPKYQKFHEIWLGRNCFRRRSFEEKINLSTIKFIPISFFVLSQQKKHPSSNIHHPAI